jgi:hypothetical protein
MLGLQEVALILLQQQITFKNYIFRYGGQNIGEPCDLDIPGVSCNNFGSNIYENLPGLEKYFHSMIHTLPIDIYNQGYFNLLLEGEIDWPGQFHPTEKIVKTLISGMPFVLAGSPGFLQHLKLIGFETYSSLWNEEYDTIQDYNQRMQAIVNLCNDLQHFDWNKNQQQLKSIANANRSNFFNLHNLANAEFNKFETAIENLLCENIIL